MNKYTTWCKNMTNKFSTNDCKNNSKNIYKISVIVFDELFQEYLLIFISLFAIMDSKLFLGIIPSNRLLVIIVRIISANYLLFLESFCDIDF